MKTKEEAKANLEASLTYVRGRYEAGIGRADWQTKASSEAAEKNYADGVNKAVAKKSRQIGIRKVSNADWQALATTKGGAVIAERMRGALDKQAANYSPIYDAVKSQVDRLPAKSIDFRANITSRLIPVVEAEKKAAGKL